MQTLPERPAAIPIILIWLDGSGPSRAPALQRQADDNEDELIDLYLDARLQAERSYLAESRDR